MRRKVKAKARQKVKRVRGKSGGLTESLVKVFMKAKKPLHIDDILERLIAGGHKTASKDLKNQLSARLYTSKDFVLTAPGTFALKDMGAKAPVKKSAKVKGKKTK